MLAGYRLVNHKSLANNCTVSWSDPQIYLKVKHCNGQRNCKKTPKSYISDFTGLSMLNVQIHEFTFTVQLEID